MTRRHDRLSQPRLGRLEWRWLPADPDAFGRFSERLARFFGTARYLWLQTVVVLAWVAVNLLPATRMWHWDPYPFILLNLAFSTQAAYAAPLILLAETRQAERDRAQAERDRAHMHRVVADAEFLARELVALRLGQGEVVTRDYLNDRLRTELDHLAHRLLDAAPAETAAGASGRAEHDT
ncbi:MAG: DUF1003 domain-containing protein [Pseudonocardia sp.]|nr:DUF1003 domain-containing protein [Pseudonocardia sp.]